MKSSYCCVNCELEFGVEADYISHYRSEHHRYNIKRKLIDLPPLSLADYQLQFEDDQTSRQSSHQELHCEICGRKFMSAGTYHAHLKSKKHKLNRDKIKAPDALSQHHSETSSEFSVIGAEKTSRCLFCHETESKEHLKTQHSFPPFENECSDYKGLVEYIRERLSAGECIVCGNQFGTEESVRQHMADVGHCKLDVDNFGQFERFYMWQIEQSSEQDQQLTMEAEPQHVEGFVELKHPTLEEIERRRMAKIKYTATGAIINGKEVGYRHLKAYYKQYLGRVMENPRAKYQPALEGPQNNDWRQGAVRLIAPPKITQAGNTR